MERSEIRLVLKNCSLLTIKEMALGMNNEVLCCHAEYTLYY